MVVRSRHEAIDVTERQVNGLIESFFGTLKCEMFYGFQRNFQNISELHRAISNYIDYYNTKRIKDKLKGRTRMEHRSFVLKQAQ
ncbi:IS3 family transposase [Fructobacillus parabroussonetiae]|uniref:IS3 family transposase n=1 Tax=Fructobacillus parabroussonetiae TaxID=2713174 RepID=A0ABS5QWB9_9LACO|nr:IS3 family transposase [Fructobacillus parabroussonetiae]